MNTHLSMQRNRNTHTYACSSNGSHYICKCMKNKHLLYTRTHMSYKPAYRNRRWQAFKPFVRLIATFSLWSIKASGSSLKGCVCVCVCEHLTGLMGQPVTTKMAKQLVGQREINVRWWGYCVCVCLCLWERVWLCVSVFIFTCAFVCLCA